jgi:hypothetical protein
VRIDGAEVAVVDQYGPGRDLPFTWERTGLGPGPHRLRLEVLGERSPESKGTWVNVRDFEPATADAPTIDAAAIAAARVRTQGQTGALLLDVKDVDGKPVELRDYASAGMHRTPYVTWLAIRGLPAAAPFSKENPSRTVRAAR